MGSDESGLIGLYIPLSHPANKLFLQNFYFYFSGHDRLYKYHHTIVKIENIREFCFDCINLLEDEDQYFYSADGFKRCLPCEEIFCKKAFELANADSLKRQKEAKRKQIKERIALFRIAEENYKKDRFDASEAFDVKQFTDTGRYKTNEEDVSDVDGEEDDNDSDNDNHNDDNDEDWLPKNPLQKRKPVCFAGKQGSSVQNMPKKCEFTSVEQSQDTISGKEGPLLFC